jgi:hypothetical protein
VATLAVAILKAATARVAATSKNANRKNSFEQKKILRIIFLYRFERNIAKSS